MPQTKSAPSAAPELESMPLTKMIVDWPRGTGYDGARKIHQQLAVALEADVAERRTKQKAERGE